VKLIVDGGTFFSDRALHSTHTGLLIDLAKECVQASAAGASWSQALSTYAASATAGTTRGSWLQGSTQEAKAQKSIMKKLFRPHAVATDASSSVPAAVDINALELFANKKRSASAETPDATSEEEGVYLDLHSGRSSTISPEQLVEVREVLPFVWGGASPFWSPLMTRALLLEPMRELALSGTVDKVFLFLLSLRTSVTFACSSAGAGMRGYGCGQGESCAVPGAEVPGRR
jgi:hypothetical protein